MNQPDMDEFYESIGKEMHAKKNRVRNIIGDSHWGEEGKYKEILLKKMIQHYLPQDLSIGTGFIATKTNESISTTSQIDLILYQNSYPPLFREEDFVILHPEPICAIIEVKTNIRNSKKDLEKILVKASRNAIEVLRNKKRPHSPVHFFNGIFSYDTEMDHKAVLEAYKKHWDVILKDPEIDTPLMVEGTVSHMCLNQDIYFKKDYHGFGAFQTKQQAPAYFISKLFEHLKFNEIYGYDDWFAFPRDDGKKIDGIITIDSPEDE
jgi:hypothetical protein